MKTSLSSGLISLSSLNWKYVKVFPQRPDKAWTEPYSTPLLRAMVRGSEFSDRRAPYLKKYAKKNLSNLLCRT